MLNKGKGGKSVAPVQTSGRKNNKPSKKYPRTAPAASGRGKATGRTVGGYSPAKLAIRAEKRRTN
jgi:hypothetical protein